MNDLSKLEKRKIISVLLLVVLIKNEKLKFFSTICDIFLNKMAEKQKVDLGLLEEDDEFEEFPTEHWGTEDADDADVSVWEDNWEDDIVQDDFSQQLRQQLEKLREQNKT